MTPYSGVLISFIKWVFMLTLVFILVILLIASESRRSQGAWLHWPGTSVTGPNSSRQTEVRWLIRFFVDKCFNPKNQHYFSHYVFLLILVGKSPSCTIESMIKLVLTIHRDELLQIMKYKQRTSSCGLNSARSRTAARSIIQCLEDSVSDSFKMQLLSELLAAMDTPYRARRADDHRTKRKRSRVFVDEVRQTF